MTSHIGQAPQDNFNHGHYNGNTVHPERFADPYGGSTPAHPDGPRGELKRPMDSKKTMKIVAAIGAGVVTAMVAGGAYGFYKVKEIEDGITGGQDRSVSQPYNPGEVTNTPEIQSSTLSPNVELAQKNFDSEKSMIPKKIENHLVAKGWGDYKWKIEPIANASQTMTPQQIVNRSSAINYWLTANPNKPQALGQADLMAQPSTETYDKLQSDINRLTSDTAVADPRVVGKARLFTSGHFENNGVIIDSNNKPTYLIPSQSYTKRTVAIEAYQWQTDNTGKIGEWRVIDVLTPNDEGWVDPLSIGSIPIVGEQK